MRDSDAPRLDGMPKLHVAALLGDLEPAVGLQRRENVSAVHECIRYTLMSISQPKRAHEYTLAVEGEPRQAKNVEAERKVGQLLKETAERGERDKPGGDRRSSSREPRMKLGDKGISYDQSSRWQALADVPEDQFEEALAGPDMPHPRHQPDPIIAPAAPPSRFLKRPSFARGRPPLAIAGPSTLGASTTASTIRRDSPQRPSA
jgi:hypothetical protein